MIDRYSSKLMKEIFSDEHKFNNFLKIEEAVVEAYVHLNVVPEEDYKKIVEKAYINLPRIQELEEITKHDVIAFTRSISEELGDEKKWIHYSLTSTDVVDSAQSLTLHEANKYIEDDLNDLLDTLKEKALQYKNQPIIGRTHGIHAEITSFGLKYALWYDELNRAIKRFEEERRNVEVIKLSGAVGNYANIPMAVEEFVAKKFCLPYALISTQVLSRDRHAGYIYSLAAIASLLEKMATEIRHLSRTEIKEVEEYFSKGQKGSSAMPHKRNPIGSENICGCARIMKSYVQVALEDNTLWHERDISHSSAERIMLPDAVSLLDYMLKRMTKILKNLVVYKEKMLEEIQEKTEEIKGRAEELHKVIEETIAQKKQQHQEARYIELGAGDSQDKKTVIIKDGYGLVLGGGGGRGSYEIGVWKALEEYKDVIDIKAVSGSSVGALNAALYACGDLDKATQMWYDITNDRILSNKDIDEDNRNKWFESIKEKLTTIDNPVIQSAIECIGLDAVAKGMKIKDGFFSI